MEFVALHWFYGYLVVIVGGLLLFVAIAHILYQKRVPTAMMSWMMAIIFMPLLTVPLYFLIGIRKRENKYAKATVELHRADKDHIVTPSGSYSGISSILENNGIPPATQGNHYELITDDREAFARLMHEITHANSSIELATYVFSYDITTKRILEELTKKAELGIQVRLLLDVVGSLNLYLWQKPFKKLKDAGGEVAFFTPILRRPFQNYINLRNHRKIYLFDRKRLLSGGMNLSNEYLGETNDINR